jgi:hypothetical protein
MKSFNRVLPYTGLFLVLNLFFSVSAIAQTYVNDGDDLRDYVNAAAPGDVFIVTDGTYNDFEASSSKLKP